MKPLTVINNLRARASGLVRATIENRLPPALGRRLSQVSVFIKDVSDSRHWPERPQAINFEITAVCDARCIHCPRHEMDRSQRPMEMQLFKKLIDEAAELRVPELHPNGFGEILTMRNIEEHLAYARSKDHRFRILVNTNGFRLDDTKIDQFLRHEVDMLNITLDGATPETFEKIRVHLKLDQIEDNIRRLIAERDRRGLKLPKIRIGMIVMAQNRHELEPLLEKWRGVADFVGGSGFSNRGGSLERDEFKIVSTSDAISATASQQCVLPFRELNIWSDGRAVLCCDDWNEEHVVGDLNQQSLREIWRGDELRRARELHMACRGNEIEICAKCSMWREPSGGARLWS